MNLFNKILKKDENSDKKNNFNNSMNQNNAGYTVNSQNNNMMQNNNYAGNNLNNDNINPNIVNSMNQNNVGYTVNSQNNNMYQNNSINPADDIFSAVANKKPVEEEIQKIEINPATEAFKQVRAINTDFNKPEKNKKMEENNEFITMEELMKKEDENKNN